MHITPSQYAQTFAQIKRTSLSHSTCKLVIFVSCLSIDALCAAKIISMLLRKELIQYQLIPVVGYSDLKSHFTKLDADVANVLLVGCGAMLDLESFFEVDADEYTEPATHRDPGEIDVNDDLHQNKQRHKDYSLTRTIYVMDGHRPWNLDNVFGSSMVVCFDDGFVDLNLTEEKSAYSSLIEESDDDTDGDESSTDEDDEIEGDDDLDEIETDINSADESLIKSQDSPDTQSRKRQRQATNFKKLKRQNRRAKERHQDTIQQYYNQGTTIITSVTAVVYAFISTIGETSIENLWLAIIGTSSLDLNYPEVYEKLQPLFKDEVIRLNPSNSSGNGSNNAEKTADSYTLSVERDYHLFLLRHWTLYDAFFYSSHVNSKLNLWTEDGKKKLHKLFAKMGISLAAAQQKWLYMDIRVKRELPVIFSKYLPIYGLENIVRDGFIRTYGFTGQLSAMECVELLTALLEMDKRILTGDLADAVANEEEDADEGEDDDDRIRGRIDRKEKAMVKNFWSSWDALNMSSSNTGANKINIGTTRLKGYELLAEGLEHAKIIQEVIFRAGMSLLERKLVKNLRLYRLCVLQDGSVPDLVLFNNPLMLTKLGTWLLDNITELDFANNNKSLKPLVAASLDVATDTYLVIGLAPKYPRGMDNNTRAMLAQGTEPGNPNGGMLTTRLNTFSVAFQQLANTSGAKVRIDSFDSSVIEIRKDDLPPFLEKLTLSGLI